MKQETQKEISASRFPGIKIGIGPKDERGGIERNLVVILQFGETGGAILATENVCRSEAHLAFSSVVGLHLAASGEGDS